MHHEASKLQTLTHPNIVRVFDCDRDGQTVFMTMEYLDGTSLRRRMPKNPGDAAMPREEALRIIASIADALDFAHRNHIVHGDLKPSNVIVTSADDVKVIDFGIARFLAAPAGRRRAHRRLGARLQRAHAAVCQPRDARWRRAGSARRHLRARQHRL